MFFFCEKMYWEKMVSKGCIRAFGPRWPSKPVGPTGPRLDSYGGQDFVSGSTTRKLLQINIWCVMCCVEWLWENGPSVLRGAKRRDYKKYRIGYPTKIWRQNIDFERSEKGIFWETRKSTLLEKSISKPFSELGFLKFCRHFYLHGIHGLIWFCRKLYR